MLKLKLQYFGHLMRRVDSLEHLHVEPASLCTQAVAQHGGGPDLVVLNAVRPSPGALPNPGIKPMSPTLQADSLLSEPPRKLNYQESIIKI